jgi:acetoin utilization protein AcuA
MSTLQMQIHSRQSNQQTMQNQQYETKHRMIRLCNFCTPDEIHRYTFDREFKNYAQYKSIYTKRKTLEEKAGQSDTNVVLALVDKAHIIGFGVLTYPEETERWARLKPGLMMEIKALEVCRSWRSAKVAKGILNMLLSQQGVENKILYLVAYSWTWDLEGTNKTIDEYRKMLIHLYTSFGFQEYLTNEPNICLKPENFFMARIGKNVSQEFIRKFKWLVFDIY